MSRRECAGLRLPMRRDAQTQQINKAFDAYVKALHKLVLYDPKALAREWVKAGGEREILREMVEAALAFHMELVEGGRHPELSPWANLQTNSPREITWKTGPSQGE